MNATVVSAVIGGTIGFVGYEFIAWMRARKDQLAIEKYEAETAAKELRARCERWSDISRNLAIGLGLLAKKHPQIETDVVVRLNYSDEKVYEKGAKALEEYVVYRDELIGADLRMWKGVGDVAKRT